MSFHTLATINREKTAMHLFVCGPVIQHPFVVRDMNAALTYWIVNHERQTVLSDQQRDLQRGPLS